MNASDFAEIFDNLKSILKKYENKLKVQENSKDCYTLLGQYSERFKKDLWFGSVQIKKNYVSYHLMPVYMYKALAKEIPAKLKKRMQGKSCFNFSKVDKELFAELDKFTDKSFKMFSKKGDDVSFG